MRRVYGLLVAGFVAVGVIVAVTATGSYAADAKSLPVQIKPDDNALYYLGRWEIKSDGAKAAWSNCTVTFRFKGTAAAASFTDGGQNRYQVVVDGKDGRVLDLKKGKADYALAERLQDGEHTISVIRMTEPLVGATTLDGISLSEGAKLLAVTPAKRRIEIIGDSISAGYGNEATRKEDHFSAATENGNLTYGAIAARELGAEYVCLAWSGRKLWPNNSMPEIYDRTLPDKADSKWDFSTWTPDVVLINLGTNDFGGKENPAEEGWVTAYVNFISKIRKNYPKATIYLATGPMMSDGYPPGRKALTTVRKYIASAIEQCAKGGDKNAKTIDFATQDGSTGYGADWHPSLKTHERMAQQLVKILQADMKWSEAGSGTTSKPAAKGD